MSIIEKQRIAYGNNFRKFGATPLGTFQNNTKTQYLRFEKLIQHLYFEKKPVSIHDIGAGICDLHEFMVNNNISHTYSGTEIVQEMIDYSLQKYPNIKLFNRDLINNTNPSEKYDYVVLSGTLNIRHFLNEIKWKEYCFQLIKKMYELADKAISFNFLTTYNDFSNDELTYFNPLELFDFCIKNLSRFTLLDHAYALYEGTITVYKNNFMKLNYNSNELSKYFK